MKVTLTTGLHAVSGATSITSLTYCASHGGSVNPNSTGSPESEAPESDLMSGERRTVTDRLPDRGLSATKPSVDRSSHTTSPGTGGSRARRDWSALSKGSSSVIGWLNAISARVKLFTSP